MVLAEENTLKGNVTRHGYTNKRPHKNYVSLNILLIATCVYENGFKMTTLSLK